MRERKGTKPTQFGIKLLEHSEVISNQIIQLERDMQDMQAPPQQPIYFFCRQNHPILQLDTLTLAEIFKYPFAAPYMASHYKQALIKRFKLGNIKSERFSSSCDIECDNLDTIETIVQHSDVISITTPSIYKTFPDTLALIPLEVPNFKTNYAIITLPEHKISPQAQAFIEQLLN